MSPFQCPLQINTNTVGDAPAIIYNEQTISYTELNCAVETAVNQFQNLGITESTRVALLINNPCDGLIAMYALWRLKAIACPINTRLPETVITEQLEQIQATYLLKSKFDYDSNDINIIDITDIYKLSQQAVFTFDAHEVKPIEFDINQEATILFTSGSISSPKAVLHTLGNYYFSAQGANDHIAVEQGDRWALTLPLYHVGGLSVIFRVFLGQATIVISDQQNDWDQINESKITHCSMVATQLYRLLSKLTDSQKTSTLKAVLIGGGPVSETLVESAIKANVPIYITYGLTEMTSQVATSAKLSTNKEAAQILKYRQLKISDNQEIYVKGEVLFKGYVNHDTIDQPFEKEGWFKTGDLGLLENEKLYVLGRKDNMFISGGENIHPEEIENCLNNINGIQSACVIPISNEEFGQRPVAFLKYDQNNSIKKEALLDSLIQTLPKYKCPDYFYQWPEEIRQEGLKINRTYLQQFLKDNFNSLKPI